MGKGHEGEIDSVEHQLDGHEDSDEAALDEEADDSERKQERREDQIPACWDCVHIHQEWPSFLASATAPRMAIRMSTLVSSKGRSMSRKRTLLSSCVVVMPSLSLT